MPYLFFLFCRKFPNAGRNIIRKETIKRLPQEISHDPHFQPRYNPWEQRLCISPDGDFFAALRSGKASIVTDSIASVNATRILTDNGTTLDADIIITATGLKMQLAGGAHITVNGTSINYAEKFIWKSAMLQDMPNAFFIIGYTNASWTLGADTAATLICRLCKYLDTQKKGSATPRVGDDVHMREQPMLNLNSTYIEKAKGQLPKAGDVLPWIPRQSYVQDLWGALYGSLTKGLEFEKLAVR
jgi:cation diffusion facilitator CzcD-associated flavoprotein CzcO